MRKGQCWLWWKCCLVTGSVLLLGATGCSPVDSNRSGEAVFATDDLQNVIQDSVAVNGLVSMQPATDSSTSGLTAENVLSHVDATFDTGTRAADALGDTYLASRILEDRTPHIVSQQSVDSMGQVVDLADKTSAVNGTTAHLMRAVILKNAGRLQPAEEHKTLERYSRLVAEGCPATEVTSCIHAVDAAFALSETPPPLTIPVPENLPAGPRGEELVYRVLARSHGVANVDEWLQVARTEKLEPLSAVGDSSKPASLRLWAAAARSSLHPELGTAEETRVQDGLAALTSCHGVDRLAVRDEGTQACSLDSTVAFYMSGIWGMQ